VKRRTILTALGVTVGTAVQADGTKSARLVSLVQLLARSPELDGGVVMTAGFFVVGVETADLYLHREDYEACLLPNSVQVKLTPEQRNQWAAFNGTHVAIKAQFKTAVGNDTQAGVLFAVEALDRIPGRAVS
jgi:hypothetical protein